MFWLVPPQEDPGQVTQAPSSTPWSSGSDGEPDQAMDMTQPQGDPVPSSICHACGPHRLDKPKIVEFQPNCQVASDAIQKAEEDEYAGRFTRAFVEHLAVSGRETTYKALNRHILEKFDVHNWDKPENEFQVPQLYTSANMEDDFEREIDI
ncbi:hypothetical protein FRC09_010505 [Ceratobasidium sp. 395]|nr:hypothetical protein FRC09_010505 [Ceratobasidium sp. 395]